MSEDLIYLKMKKRIFERIKMPSALWDTFEKDVFELNISKNIICNKYNIKPSELKWIKRIIKKEV